MNPKGVPLKCRADRRRVVGGVEERRCVKCGEWQALITFSRNPKCVGGYGYSCRRCTNARWERNRMLAEERAARGSAGGLNLRSK